MMQTPEDRRPPLTPQLALRVAIVGSVALAMFAIIFFRLWFLQVLSGDQYLAKASVNRVRTLAVPAARGQILDRDGHILVDSKPSIAVQLSPPDLPRTGAKRRRMYARLAQVLGGPDAAPELHDHRRPARRPRPARADRVRGRPAARAAALRERHDQDRRVGRRPRLPRRAPGPVPGGERRAGVAAALSAARPRRPAVRDRRSDLPGRAQADSLPRRQPAVDRRPVRPGVVLRPLPARPGRRRARAGRRPRPVQGLPVRAQADRRALAQAVAQPGPPEAQASRRSRRRSRTAHRHRRARSSRSTRSTARCTRWAPPRRSIRTSSPSR